MKKTTYAIIALVALSLAGMLIFFAVLSRHGKPTDSDDAILVSGPVKTISTAPFDQIFILDQNENSFVDVDGDEYSDADAVFRIQVIDSLTQPEILMPEGWEDYVEYSAGNSRLQFSFTSRREDFNVGDNVITILTPSLKTLDVLGDVPVIISDSRLGSLTARFRDRLELHNTAIGKLDMTERSKYSSTSIFARDSEVDSLVVRNVNDVIVSGERISHIVLFGSTEITSCDATILTDAATVTTVAADPSQTFNIGISGSRSLKLTE